MDSIGTTFNPHARLSVLRTETRNLRLNLFVSDGSNGLHRHDFQFPYSAYISVLRTQTLHLRWNIFVFHGSDGVHRNEFRTPLTAWLQLSKCLTTTSTCPMDPMDSIRTTFDPFLRIDAFFLSVLRTETPHVRWNLFVSDGSDGLHRNDFRPPLTAWWQFSKCLTNRNSTCPMESIRVRWIRWTPSERLSTPSDSLMTIFEVSYEQKLHMSDGIYSCPMEHPL